MAQRIQINKSELREMARQVLVSSSHLTKQSVIHPFPQVSRANQTRLLFIISIAAVILITGIYAWRSIQEDYTPIISPLINKQSEANKNKSGNAPESFFDGRKVSDAVLETNSSDNSALSDVRNSNYSSADMQENGLDLVWQSEYFQRNVVLIPNSSGQGGFVVQKVEPNSMYELFGLRPGDVVYSLDGMPSYNAWENSQVFEVYRDGQRVLLKLSLS